DCGVVSTKEPFQKLFNQGMILAHSYQSNANKYFHPEEVEQREDKVWVVKQTGEPVSMQIEKMSKSRLNVVNPDQVIEQYGADAMRGYEMFMGPLDQDKPWADKGIQGVYRFLSRVWRLFVQDGQIKYPEDATFPEAPLEKLLHKTIKKVGEDIESMRFNTGIAALMELNNACYKHKQLPRALLEPFTLLLAPYFPHLAEELWHKLGHTGTLAHEPWSEYNPAMVVDEHITVVVQVNGKLKAKLQVPNHLEPSELKSHARQADEIEPLLEGKTIRKVIVVPNRLVNFVVST
ncbi:MAG: class I tRNA ligase family protein, partial [Myxococcota bacterium]